MNVISQNLTYFPNMIMSASYLNLNRVRTVIGSKYCHWWPCPFKLLNTWGHLSLTDLCHNLAFSAMCRKSTTFSVLLTYHEYGICNMIKFTYITLGYCQLTLGVNWLDCGNGFGIWALPLTSCWRLDPLGSARELYVGYLKHLPPHLDSFEVSAAWFGPSSVELQGRILNRQFTLT